MQAHNGNQPGRAAARRGRNKQQHELRLPPSSPRVIVAFVGQNENGILRAHSQAFMALAQPWGLTGTVLDLGDPTWMDQLRSLLEQGVLFAWGHAGIGARLTIGTTPLWDAVKVPFIAMHSDSPCWMPANHYVASDYVANGYVFQDWLDVQKRLIQSPQISALLPHGVMDHPLRDAIAWSDRPRRMLFVKTGHAPALHRSRWLQLPPRFRAIIEETSAAILAQGVGDITETLLQCLDHHGLYLDQRPDVLLALMQKIDVYVRDCRSTAMVEAMLDLPVDIIGRGWDHMKRLGGKARFHSAVDAAALPRLYAETQFLLNTMPNFAACTHERVLQGFASRCCVVTNENAFMREAFGSLPSYFGVDTEADGLPEQLATLFHSPRRFDDCLQPALDLVTSEFDPGLMMRGLIELALEVREATNYTSFKYAVA